MYYINGKISVKYNKTSLKLNLEYLIYALENYIFHHSIIIILKILPSNFLRTRVVFKFCVFYQC